MAILVIISCSARKKATPKSAIPAIDRYDGVFYRLIRKAVREGRMSKSIRLVILSAKYGYLSPSSPITSYEQRMDRSRSSELKPMVQRKLRSLLKRSSFQQVYVNLGRDYADLIAGIPEIENAIWATGGIGTRAQILKRWVSSVDPAAVRRLA